MLVLVVTLVLLLLLLRRLLSSSSAYLPIAAPKKKRLSATEKIAAEAFEYTPSHPLNPFNILILYATEYGFAREVARKAAHTLSEVISTDATAASVTIVPRVLNVLHYPLLDFTNETFVVFVCSTTGDGVPPNEAASFHHALVMKDLVIPPACRTSILALGDRAYPNFCRAGALFDALFAHSRLVHRQDIDQEDWPVIDVWIHTVADALQNHVSQAQPAQHDYLPDAIQKYAASTANDTAQYTRNNPFHAPITRRRLLTRENTGSSDDKEVIRVEFDLSQSDITYNVGDALGVMPSNNFEHVQRVLLAMALGGNEMVRVHTDDDPQTLQSVLLKKLDLRTVPPELFAKLAARCDMDEERDLAKRLLHRGNFTDAGKSYVAEREVFDVLSAFVNARVTAQELVDCLRPLHARYYSISSSPVTCSDRVAITVDVLRYSSLNVEREGVASTYLQDRCHVKQQKVPLFIMRNPNFSLPKDGSKPVLMIGPGTGIAPFIGFVEERIATDATGENWLVFGCRHENQDFLYKEQLLTWADEGNVTLDTAFSRDGPKKVYVQHRLRQKADKVWTCIDSDSAHVYVCGDGGHMAGDVDKVLREIVSQCGGMSDREAAAYLSRLAEMKRYQKDVWVS